MPAGMHDYVAILGKGALTYTDSPLYRDTVVQFPYRRPEDMVIRRPTAFGQSARNRTLQPTTAIPVARP